MLVLVAAFVGREEILRVYAEAIERELELSALIATADGPAPTTAKRSRR